MRLWCGSFIRKSVHCTCGNFVAAAALLSRLLSADVPETDTLQVPNLGACVGISHQLALLDEAFTDRMDCLVMKGRKMIDS